MDHQVDIFFKDSRTYFHNIMANHILHVLQGLCSKRVWVLKWPAGSPDVSQMKTFDAFKKKYSKGGPELLSSWNHILPFKTLAICLLCFPKDWSTSQHFQRQWEMILFSLTFSTLQQRGDMVELLARLARGKEGVFAGTYGWEHINTPWAWDVPGSSCCFSWTGILWYDHSDGDGD